MEDTDVPARATNDLTAQLQAMIELQTKGKSERKTINTRHILFIVSGAFTGLKDIVRRRVVRRSIGFGPAEGYTRDEDFALLRQAKAADFVEYGFEPEFIGRLPVVVACHDLSEDHLFDILTRSEGSLLNQLRESFRAYDIETVFSEPALRLIARHAHREGTGARGLGSVLERTLREFKFSLPGGEVKRFAVSEATVNDPVADLEAVLRGGEANERNVLAEMLRQFERDFSATHGVSVRFAPDAADAVVEKSLSLGAEPREVAGALLQGYEHGLRLIQSNTGQTEFVITREALEHPAEVLGRWIREACNR
jgi:hypothetical protein